MTTMNNTQLQGISFVIITNGKRFNTTIKVLDSIHTTMENKIPYEIIIVGDVEKYHGVGATLLDYKSLADNGNLSAMRNRGAEQATYEVLVMIDDDIIFHESWFDNLATFSSQNAWTVYACKVLMPDGGRYWDKAIMFGEYHCLVNYQHDKHDSNLYQTGGYLVIQKDVLLKIQFNENITFYSAKLVNEDVDFSRRLYANNYYIDFDSNNTVYHDDDRYVQIRNNTRRKIDCENFDGLNQESITRYEAVYNLYLTHLGRRPDESGLLHYLESKRSIEEIENILLGSDEYRSMEKK